MYGDDFHGMIGRSEAMRRVFDLIRLAGDSELPVLITGKTGTGKELAARAVHEESRRRSGPFVPVNCGALSETVLESELFGHVRGAFTDAIRARKGRFELADGGTLFLDEVAELSPAAQVKLLRVLEDHRVERVGDEQTIRVNVRIVAATQANLRSAMVNGAFREDFFHRLNVIPIEIPPLCERRDDIPLIAQRILGHIRLETGRPIYAVDRSALELLCAYPWPGNVRHLISTLQYAAIRCSGETIRPEHLPYWNAWSAFPT